MRHKRNNDLAIQSAAPVSTSLLAAVLTGACAGLVTLSDVALAQRDASSIVAGRLNTTGRTIPMSVVLKEAGASMGEIDIKITPQDAVLVSKAALIERLSGRVTPETLAKATGVTDSSGFVAIKDLKAAGLNLEFNSGLLELAFSPTADQRPMGNLSISRPRLSSPDATLQAPAKVAGFLNIIAGGDYVWGAQGREDGFEAARIDFTGALTFWGLAFENEMTYQGENASSRDLYGRPLYRFDAEGFKRRRSRLVYDIPENQVRIQLGDTDTLATSFQSANSVLGASIEKSPRKLAPGENIRSTGRSSFRIDRPADVDIVVNGTIVQRLPLRPGNYNLSDLPLSAGANDVELIINDDTGQRRSLKFSNYIDDKVLAPGRTEWALTGGLPSYISDSQVNYVHDNEWFASGFYRLGLNDFMTAEAHAQADNRVVMGGLVSYLRSGFGLFSLDAAGSHHEVRGTGFATNLGWSIANFTGITGGKESFHAGAEYRTRAFSMAGESASTAEITARDPRYYAYLNPYWLRLYSAYTFPVNQSITGTLAGRYQFSDESLRINELSSYQVIGDRYGGDLTLSMPLSATASMSLTAGYSNEAYRYRLDRPVNTDGEFRAALRVFIRPDEKTSIMVGYDTLNAQSSVSATRIEGRGIGRWETTVNAHHDNGQERAGASGSLAYYGNRFEARVAQSSAFDGIGYDRFGVRPADQRTSVRVGTSIAFADGYVGIGAPVRNNGFAIVVPHESLAGREVIVGSPGVVRAKSDGLGPAVVGDLPAYSPGMLQVDVADLPIGYSLGTGTFDVLASYRSGYALVVGSSYSVSAFGTLLQADGSPVALLTGTATSTKHSGRRVQVFTNSAGRFGAEGLAPGRWVIEMATEPHPTRYVIDIPDGTQGLFKAGDIMPARGG